MKDKPIHIPILVISILEILLAALIFGLHYGWIDDVSSMLSVRGIIVNVPAYGDFYHFIHNIWGELYKALFKLAPGFDWFALGHMLLVFCALANINYILFKLVRHLNRSPALFYVLSVVFFAALNAEDVFLFNSTKLSMLVTGSALLVIVQLLAKNGPISRRLLILQCFLFVAGFNVRFTVSSIMVISCGAFGFLFLFNVNRKRALMFVSALMVFVGLFTLYFKIDLDPEERKFVKIHDQLLNLLDGFNGLVYNLDHQKNSDLALEVKIDALEYWFLGDSERLLDPDFLNDLGSHSPLTLTTLGNWQDNLRNEVVKSRDSFKPEYHAGMNWFYKSIGYMVLVLLMLLLIFTSKASLQLKITALLFVLVMAAEIFLITIFFKMEDRVLHPLLLMTLLGTVLFYIRVRFEHADQKPSIPVLSMLFIGILSMACWRSIENYGLAKEKTNEYKLKKELFREMDKTFGDQLILYDLYTYTTYPARPFRLHHPEYPDKRLSYIEIWNLLAPEHHKTLQNICRDLDMDAFFKCLAEKEEPVILFYNFERIKVLKKYLEIIFGDRYCFERLEPEVQFRYSYFWFQMDMGFFSIQKNE